MSTFGKVVASLALGSLSLSLAATAATITYSNEATFASATGSATLTLPNANNVDLVIPGELSIKKIESAPGGFFAGTDIATYWDKAPNYTVKNGIESFDLIPLKSIYAIGFSLYEPTSTARLNGCNKSFCVNSSFEIELFSDVASLGKYTIGPPNDEFAFYGYWTADRIARVTIREAVVTSPSAGGLSDDNEFFGRFMTGTTSNVAAPPAVPLPAAAWLLLSGLGGLGFLGRRRKTV